MKNPNFWLISFLISALTAVGQITNTIYVPAMGRIAVDLLVHLHYVQLLMAAYLFPYGVSQFFYGAISDHIGRRKTIILGLIIYIIGSVVTVIAKNFEVLLIGSLIQGAGIGVGGVMARTVMRDLYEGFHLQKANSILSTILIFAPLFAPLIGGMLTALINWRAIFYFLLCFSIVVILLQAILLPETNKFINKKEKLNLKTIFHHNKTIISNKNFFGYTLIVLMAFSGISVFEACAGLIFDNVLGYSVLITSILFVIPLPAYMIGSYFAARLAKFYNLQQILKIAIFLIIFSGLLMVGLRLIGLINAWVIIIPMIFYLLATGLLFPTATTAALMPFPKRAGSAASIMGGIQNLGAGVCTLISSNFQQTSQLPLGIILSCLALIIAWSYWFFISGVTSFSESEKSTL